MGIIETDHAINILRQNWSKLGEVIEFGRQIANHGSDNVIFTTRDYTKYIFRAIFLHPIMVHNNSQIYEYLYDSGIPTALPLKTDSGEYFIDAANDYPGRDACYSVHTFIEGDDENVDKTDPELAGEMAAILGTFHRVMYDLDYNTLDLRGVTKQEVTEWMKRENLPRGFDEPMNEVPDHPLVQEMFEVWKQWASSVDTSNLTHGVVHGDIGPGCNIMVDGKQVTGIIDLYGIHYTFLMMDVGTYCMYGGLLKADRKHLFDIFKTNYLKESPVTEEEFQLLPYFILRRYLTQAFYFNWRLQSGYEQGNTEEDNNEKGFSDAIEMLTFWKKKFHANRNISEFNLQ